jgi:hypothetical protein
MGLRSFLGELRTAWQRGREERRRVRSARTDAKNAEELDEARAGLWRRPTSGS